MSRRRRSRSPVRYSHYDDEYDVDYGGNHRRHYNGEDRLDRKPMVTQTSGAGRQTRISVETMAPYAEKYETDRQTRAKMRLEERKLTYERAKQQARRKDASKRRSSRRERPNVRIGSPQGSDVVPGPPPPPSSDSISEDSSDLSSSDGSFDDKDTYGFDLPIKPQAVTYEYVEEVSFPLGSESNDEARKPSRTSRSNFNGPLTEISISQSSWRGSAYDRGDLGAQISSLLNRNQAKEKHSAPLMKWYHLERSVMSFEEFMAAAKRVLQLSPKTQRNVDQLLRDVQKKYEKQRQYGRDLEPSCLSDIFQRDEKIATSQGASQAFL